MKKNKQTGMEADVARVARVVGRMDTPIPELLNFSGFTDPANLAHWRGVLGWLMNPTKFKVADILQCCPMIEPPTGKAREAWRQVISAMAKLMRQLIPAEGEPHPPLFQALFMLMECLPVLLPRAGSARAARGPVVSSRRLAKSEAAPCDVRV